MKEWLREWLLGPYWRALVHRVETVERELEIDPVADENGSKRARRLWWAEKQEEPLTPTEQKQWEAGL